MHNINILNNEDEKEGMVILPETNLCNYISSGELGGIMNKYMNIGENLENNYDLNNNNNPLLEHKYGNYSQKDENDKNIIKKRNTYNIEEEFPKKLNNYRNVDIKNK